MIELGVIGSILLVLWLSHSDVNHKEDTETSLCIGICLTTEAAVVDGNFNDEYDPSIKKIIKDSISGESPSTGEVK